jgi:hypothetical protein
MKLKYIVWFACALSLGVAIARWSRTPGVTVDEVNRLIEKEVPQGASVSQVESFLDSHKIEHSKIFEHSEIESDFHNNPKLDGKRERIRGVVIAILRNVESDFLVSWSIGFKFYFDKQGKLVEYTIMKIGTGL